MSDYTRRSPVTVETLPAISHQDVRVITTELLAQVYGAAPDHVLDNYRKNADRFVAGKHFFKLEGEALREFKSQPENFRLAHKFASHLILWTERGAARHAKMLNTDQAWEVFERMEEVYFRAKDLAKHEAPRPKPEWIAVHRDDLWTLTSNMAALKVLFESGMRSIEAIEQATGEPWYGRPRLAEPDTKGVTKHDTLEAQVLDEIERAGANGISTRNLVRGIWGYRNLLPNGRKSLLDKLISSSMVTVKKRFNAQTKRYSVRYVAAKFAREAQ